MVFVFIYLRVRFYKKFALKAFSVFKLLMLVS